MIKKLCIMTEVTIHVRLAVFFWALKQQDTSRNFLKKQVLLYGHFLMLMQSCGNTMPDLSNLSHFPEDK